MNTPLVELVAAASATAAHLRRIDRPTALAAVASATAALLFARHIRRRRLRSAPPMELSTLSLPDELLISTYIDLSEASARGFEHVAYLLQCRHVIAVIDGCHVEAVNWLSSTVHAARRRGEADAYVVSPLHGLMKVVPQTVGGGVPSPPRAAAPQPAPPFATRFLRSVTAAPTVTGVVVDGSGGPASGDGTAWAAAATGNGAVLLAPGATLHADRIIGVADGEAPPTLLLDSGARVLGGTIDLSGGSVHLGADAVVEPGALVRGPAVIGARCVVRHGAYIRGDVLLGADGVFGGELKNVVALDGCELPHHSYCGDSLLGHRAHLGCGAVTANFPLFESSAPSLRVASGARVALGRRKIGAVLGDRCQLGCNSVTDPGTFLAPDTHAYPLSRLRAGVYGPGEILKPRQVVERAPLLQ